MITVAALMLHVQNGFFMNWFGNQAGEGIEYHVLVAAMAIALVLTGGGKWSLDRALAKQDN
jgi:putative oxidoreductase